MIEQNDKSNPDFPNKSVEIDEPDIPGKEGDKFKFNLGLYRIESLNKILNICASRYHKAMLKKQEKYVHEYQAIVNTLFTETFIYMEEETGIEDLQVQLDKKEVLNNILDDYRSYSSEKEMMKHLKQIRDVYLSVRTLLKSVGLDIPVEEKVGKTDIFTGGD